MNAVLKPEARSALLGIVPSLSIEQYHAGPGISKSGLDLIARSPAIYYARNIDPKRPPERDRAGQLEGSLAHCAILEPEEFSKRYATLPVDAPRRPTDAQWNAKNPSPESRAAMDWWTRWNADNVGRTIIDAAQYETAMRQAESVRRLPEVKDALARGFAEQSAYWIDSATGQLCRCRPDWAHTCGDNQAILFDVKTYSDASPSEFRRQIARKRYHVQDAYYSDGYAAASGREVLAFVFIAVETEWPYAACAVMLDDIGREQGRRSYRLNLNTYATCCATGQWPGYSDSIQIVDLPRWALTGEEA